MSTSLIFQAICDSPLLMESCPEASVFDRGSLSPEKVDTPLKLNQKLGHLYEDALEFLLETSNRYEILEKSLQLQNGAHRTLGELDFLLQDLSTGEIIHLELAIKFYLAVETPEGLFLPGPDARDNYYKKLHRMRKHQLVLTQKFKEHLPIAYRDETITTQHLVLGCLFDHIDHAHTAEPAQAEYVHTSARRRKWLRQSEFAEHYSTDMKTLMVHVIPKHLWPVSVDQLDVSALSTFDFTQDLERCVLLKIQDLSYPVFITPDNYPHIG